MTSSKRAAYRESLREDILDVARPLFARGGYNSRTACNPRNRRVEALADSCEGERELPG